MTAVSKKCPRCGATLFWAEDIGSYCTSCGFKDAGGPASPLPHRYGRAEIEQPGQSDMDIYSGLAAPPKFKVGGEAPHFFNWGALLVPPLWCLGMRLWAWAIGFLVLPFAVALLVKLAVASDLATKSTGGYLFIPVVGCITIITTLASGLYLGSDGNRLAWLSRPFPNVDEFRRVQRAWAVTGLIIAVLIVGGMVTYTAIVAVKAIHAQEETPEEPLLVPPPEPSGWLRQGDAILAAYSLPAKASIAGDETAAARGRILTGQYRRPREDDALRQATTDYEGRREAVRQPAVPRAHARYGGGGRQGRQGHDLPLLQG